MSTISSLWANEKLPIRSGVYTAVGRSYSARINQEKPSGMEIGDEFDLDEFLKADPDWLTSIDITGRVDLPGGAGSLCRGEGSYGSEGFFARVDERQNLIWVVYLEESNPFTGIAITGNTATFTSSSDMRMTVDIDRPWAGDGMDLS